MHKLTEHAPAVMWSLLAKERLLSRSIVLRFILWKLYFYAKKDLLLRSLIILFYNWISYIEPSSDIARNVISIVCISPVSLLFCHLFLPHSLSYKSSECFFFFFSFLQSHSLLEFIIELTSPQHTPGQACNSIIKTLEQSDDNESEVKDKQCAAEGRCKFARVTSEHYLLLTRDKTHVKTFYRAFCVSIAPWEYKTQFG